MMRYMLLIPLLLIGCRDVLPQNPNAKVNVEPASGGGGDIETATIPVRVQVDVEQRQKPMPGPSILGCQCKQKDPFAGETQTKQPVGLPVTIDRSGRMTWTESSGMVWWFPPGVRMANGERDQSGRWEYRDGRMIDSQGVSVTRTRQTDCLDGF